ncbi:toxin-antitoxin system YwqK family antitoxin [Reichenbachiella agariperforans]|uniref:toxin-antitoxin system YwqK family antitoxin n=1 Tax=Reichenbachiella agariperforans TaxID=156994 RepID=UPI001C09358D|nr:hypothetical protein [Reichenbachiella agariperforans]MBU2914919.1 hypothetical protein [Reichenbachiella agariperforans]
MHKLFLIGMGLVVACTACTTRVNKLRLPDLFVSETDLTHDHRGVYYYGEKPFSGYAFELYENGEIKKESSYYEGKLEGNMIGYYSTGDTAYVRPYHLGEKQGDHLGFYPDGRPKFSYQFEQGLSEGIHRAWYPTGLLKMELNYQNGKEAGLQRVWRMDGKLKSNYVVKDNGRKYGMLGLKRCSKIDSETQNIDPYLGVQLTVSK